MVSSISKVSAQVGPVAEKQPAVVQAMRNEREKIPVKVLRLNQASKSALATSLVSQYREAHIQRNNIRTAAFTKGKSLKVLVQDIAGLEAEVATLQSDQRKCADEQVVLTQQLVDYTPEQLAFLRAKVASRQALKLYRSTKSADRGKNRAKRDRLAKDNRLLASKITTVQSQITDIQNGVYPRSFLGPKPRNLLRRAQETVAAYQAQIANNDAAVSNLLKERQVVEDQLDELSATVKALDPASVNIEMDRAALHQLLDRVDRHDRVAQILDVIAADLVKKQDALRDARHQQAIGETDSDALRALADDILRERLTPTLEKIDAELRVIKAAGIDALTKRKPLYKRSAGKKAVEQSKGKNKASSSQSSKIHNKKADGLAPEVEIIDLQDFYENRLPRSPGMTYFTEPYSSEFDQVAPDIDRLAEPFRNMFFQAQQTHMPQSVPDVQQQTSSQHQSPRFSARSTANEFDMPQSYQSYSDYVSEQDARDDVRSELYSDTNDTHSHTEFDSELDLSDDLSSTRYAGESWQYDRSDNPYRTESVIDEGSSAFSSEAGDYPYPYSHQSSGRHQRYYGDEDELSDTDSQFERLYQRYRPDLRGTLRDDYDSTGSSSDDTLKAYRAEATTSRTRSHRLQTEWFASEQSRRDDIGQRSRAYQPEADFRQTFELDSEGFSTSAQAKRQADYRPQHSRQEPYSGSFRPEFGDDTTQANDFVGPKHRAPEFRPVGQESEHEQSGSQYSYCGFDHYADSGNGYGNPLGNVFDDMPGSDSNAWSQPEARIHVESHGGESATLGEDLRRLPDPVRRTLIAGRIRFVAVSRTVIEYFPELVNEHPRGHAEGASWSTIPGIYNGNFRTVVVATAANAYPHGCFSLNLHETGHAHDHASSYASKAPAFQLAYKRDKSSLGQNYAKNYYYLQEGSAGPSETYAEGFARYFGGDRSMQAETPNIHAYFSLIARGVVPKLSP